EPRLRCGEQALDVLIAFHEHAEHLPQLVVLVELHVERAVRRSEVAREADVRVLVDADGHDDGARAAVLRELHVEDVAHLRQRRPSAGSTWPAPSRACARDAWGPRA